MPAILVHAVGKSILFGEHAVVYGQPAIAIPINNLRTKVTLSPDLKATSPTYFFDAPDIGIQDYSENLPPDHILVEALRLFKESFAIKSIPSFKLHVSSTIPLAAGLGSSASISVGIVRAIAQHLGLKLPTEKINALAYQLEKLHHGNPSGIDNSVICYERPLYYIRDQAPQFLEPGGTFSFLLINSGIHSFTAQVVAEVHRAWQANPTLFDTIFHDIGDLTNQARQAITKGDQVMLGQLMSENHRLLQKMGVSLSQLDDIVAHCINHGALGAKLCGSGKGGNVIALLKPDVVPSLQQALQSAGWTEIYQTSIA
jgi:mevalonate kinase